jgi:hypothetical protein
MTKKNGPVADLESRDREATALRHVTDALADDVKDAHDKREVAEAVEEAKKHYDDATVREFVPILVEREVRETFHHPHRGT